MIGADCVMITVVVPELPKFVKTLIDLSRNEVNFVCEMLHEI